MCPGLAEPNSRQAHVSPGQCVKFCDDTPSAAMPPNCIINRIYPGCLAASFPVQRTPAHLSAGKPQCGVNDVPALRPAETDWGALQQMVYRRKISYIEQLKHLD